MRRVLVARGLRILPDLFAFCRVKLLICFRISGAYRISNPRVGGSSPSTPATFSGFFIGLDAVSLYSTFALVQIGFGDETAPGGLSKPDFASIAGYENAGAALTRSGFLTSSSGKKANAREISVRAEGET